MVGETLTVSLLKAGTDIDGGDFGRSITVDIDGSRGGAKASRWEFESSKAGGSGVGTKTVKRNYRSHCCGTLLE
jgi:hypothetical protein